ncbi:MAG TPA: M20 family metallopeptidase [Bryobacteraceae bacterium]|nr:M20 family metallopeptidase [Bryobacteraceae bacterium]HOQ44027.1 M20 family metallopeptidase [Bryobacteraceae bacterium]HPQ13836.1 M20 family metallopeptidase [Bryobacteraceae bacterium]HPU70345.1 M20 family metallopeptidase [Bryobacteraceae bacterium]
MDSIRSYLRSRRQEMVNLCRELVECESPSDDPAAVARFVDLVCEKTAGMATMRRIPGGQFGPHLQCEFDLPGANKEGQILLLGHSDTVWPVGTLKQMPFREADNRLWGPGVLDMKAGIVLLLFAVRALRELDLPVSRRVVMQLNSDEEVGSYSSRPLTEEEARRSVAVLVLEPATGLEGKLKTARKGVGDYTIVVHGKAAHSGLDFAAGASAVVELAKQIQRITRFTRLERGITVNPGVISGGTRPNVVAAEARVEVDMRVMRTKDAAALDRKFRRLQPVDPRCRIEVSGGLKRPPMERTEGVVALFRKAQAVAAEMGIELEESLSGGASDGNFTAALGIPTLDGLGAVGEGAHAQHESILVERLDERAALLAGLLRAV